MTPRRFLPAYVSVFRDRHGKERFRFRRKGYESRYINAPLGTEDFLREYRACLDQQQTPADRAVAKAAPGSVQELFVRYVASPARLGPTETTQRKVRAVLSRFVEGRQDRPIALMTFEHIDGILAKRRIKSEVDGRTEGGIEAARKLRKELIRMFDFAIKIGMRRDNPARLSEKIKVAPGERSRGFHTWTEDEIAAFRAYHHLGSRARLAMELLLWTDQRKVDTIHLGRQHIRNGRFDITQSKTGKRLQITVAPQLLEAIVAMPPSSHLCFLVTDFGKPFSIKGFGGWFRDRCDEAGLPDCTAHGLRKATMRRMAELDMGNQTMKALSGHTQDDEVARYTADANQQRMADHAIRELARWDRGLDTDAGKPQNSVG